MNVFIIFSFDMEYERDDTVKSPYGTQNCEIFASTKITYWRSKVSHKHGNPRKYYRDKSGEANSSNFTMYFGSFVIFYRYKIVLLVREIIFRIVNNYYFI